MGNKKNINCIYPGCKKEVLEESYKFCGEHERKYIDAKDKTVKGIAGLTLASIFVIGKSLMLRFRKK